MKKLVPVLLAILAFSCRSTTEPHDAHATATIIGRVHLASANKQTPPYAGIKVSLEGTAFSATTDDSGVYRLEKVPSGTYTVRFEKAGYGYVRWIGQSVEGGGNSPIYWTDPYGTDTYYNPSLHKIPATKALIDRAEFVDTTAASSTGWHLVVGGSFDYNPPDQIVIFVGSQRSVSPAPGASRFFGIWDEYPVFGLTDTLTGRFNIAMDISWFLSHGFKSGDSVYVTSRTMDHHAEAPAKDYYDPQLGARVLTSTCQTASAVVGVRIP